MRTSSHAAIQLASKVAVGNAIAMASENGDPQGITPGSRLHTLVRAADRVGRRAGSLPATLGQVSREPGVVLADSWGRAFRYSIEERGFETRSAGRDGTFDSADDIVAIGRLGRAIPCEIRDETRTVRWDNVAPRCDDVSTVTIYPLCPPLTRADRVERGIPATQRDSILAMGRRLVRVARAIDGFGRELGTLPQTLGGPVIWDRDSRGELPDLWGSAVRYRPVHNRFELQSAGPDRTLDSADDIMVVATLGSTIPCLYRTQGRDEQCDESPPECSDELGSVRRGTSHGAGMAGIGVGVAAGPSSSPPGTPKWTAARLRWRGERVASSRPRAVGAPAPKTKPPPPLEAAGAVVHPPNPRDPNPLRRLRRRARSGR